MVLFLVSNKRSNCWTEMSTSFWQLPVFFQKCFEDPVGFRNGHDESLLHSYGTNYVICIPAEIHIVNIKQEDESSWNWAKAHLASGSKSPPKCGSQERFKILLVGRQEVMFLFFSPFILSLVCFTSVMFRFCHLRMRLNNKEALVSNI